MKVCKALYLQCLDLLMVFAKDMLQVLHFFQLLVLLQATFMLNCYSFLQNLVVSQQALKLLFKGSDFLLLNIIER